MSTGAIIGGKEGQLVPVRLSLAIIAAGPGIQRIHLHSLGPHQRHPGDSTSSSGERVESDGIVRESAGACRWCRLGGGPQGLQDLAGSEFFYGTNLAGNDFLQ